MAIGARESNVDLGIPVSGLSRDGGQTRQGRSVSAVRGMRDLKLSGLSSPSAPSPLPRNASAGSP